MDIGTIEGTLKLRDEFAEVLRRNDKLLRDFDKTLGGVDGKGLDKLGDHAETLSRNLRGVGMALTVGVVAPMAAVAKVASDFDSAFANVVKTVDGLDVDAFGKLNVEAKVLREEIRGLSRVLPTTAAELANIAAVGGQFGVERQNLVKFTDTVAKLAVAVDGISAENAAAALQQISKIANVAEGDFERLASTLVDLGNKGTSTEATILETARRFAGAGTAAGLSAQQIFGLSAAVANLGFEAEVGGTVLSKTFLEIQRATETGGAEMEAFARVAGMSARDFAKAWREDATGAFTGLITNLGKLQSEGKNVATTMEAMFGKDIRQTQIVQALSLSVGDLTKTLGNSQTAWAENTALADEARKKFATFENQVKLLKNQVYDVAIELGDALLPVLRDIIGAVGPLVSGVGNLARAFSGLPDGARQAVVYLGLGAGLAGILAILASKVIDSAKQIRDLTLAIRGLTVAQGAAGAVGGLSGALGSLAGVLARIKGILPAGAGIAGLLGLTAGAGFAAASKGIDDYKVSLGSVADRQVVLAAASQAAGRQITDFGTAWNIARAAVDKAAQSAGGMTAQQAALKGVLDATNPYLSEAGTKAGFLAGQQALLGTSGARVADTSKLAAGALAGLSGVTGVNVKVAGEAAKANEALGGKAGAAAPKVDALAEALKRANEQARLISEQDRLSFIGLDTLDEAARAAAAIGKLPKGFKLTEEAAAGAEKTIRGAFSVLKKLGIEVPKYMEDAYASVVDLRTETGSLNDEFDRSALAVAQIPQFVYPDTVEGIAAAGREARLLNLAFEQSIRSLGILMPGIDMVMAMAEDGAGEATESTAAWVDGLGELSNAFANLAQISGGALDGTMGKIAEMISLMDVGAKAGGQLAYGFQNMGSAAGWMSMASGAVTAYGSMQKATDKRTKGGRIAGGAMQGAAIGANPALMAATGGMSVLAGAAIGAIWGAARNPAWADVADRVGADMGVNISEGLAKHIADNSKTLFNGNRDAARVFNLDGIIAEAGGLTAKNVTRMQAALRDAFVMREQGAFTSDQLSATLQKNFGAFAAYVESTGRMAHKGFGEMFALAAKAGATTDDMARYVSQAMGTANTAFGTLIKNAKQASEVERAGRLIVAAFNGAQAAGMSWLESIDLFGTAIDALIAKSGEVNLAGGGLADLSAMQDLLDFRGLVEANRPLIEQFDALNQIALALGNTGSLTEQSLLDLADAAKAAYSSAVDSGFTESQALRMSEELLANLARGYQNLGLPMDEQLAAMIAQAEAMGLLKDDGEVLITTLVTGFGEVTAAVRDLAATLRGDLGGAIDGLGSIPTSGVTVPAGGGEYPGFAKGGVVSAGGGANATLHGVEVVSPLDTYNSTMLAAMQSGRGGGGPLHLTVNLDGRTITRAVLEHMADEMEINGV